MKRLTNAQIKRKFGKHLRAVLFEMCRRVGVLYDNVDFVTDNWFQQFKWTEKEQKEFEKWFVEYLYKNKKAREELFTVCSRNKTLLKQAVKWFCFQYGWSFKEK